MAIDLGDPLPGLDWTVTDANGTAADATSVILTITRVSDGTTSTPTVSHAGTGLYTASYTPLQAGRYIGVWVATGTNAQTYTDAWEVVGTDQTPLVGLDEIRAFLNVATTVTDEQLRTVGMVASEACEQYTGRVWRPLTFTESYDGGQEAIVLRHTPVSVVTTVVESSVTLPNDGTTYFIDQSGCTLYRGNPRWRFLWMPGRQNITVTYTCGPTNGIVPEMLRHGVKLMIQHLWETQRGGSNLPRQRGGDTEWDPRQGFTHGRRVTECWDPYRGPAI
jgi:hypothetical protein